MKMTFDIDSKGSKMRIERGSYGYRVVIDWPDGSQSNFYNTQWVIQTADTLTVIY